MKRTKRTVKAVVEPAGPRHISSDPYAEKMAWDAFFHTRPFFILDEQLTIEYGADQMLLLAYIRRCWEYHSMKGTLQEDGSFFIRYQDITKKTGLNDFKIRKCKNDLIRRGWFTTMKKGIPPKEYYFITASKAREKYNKLEEQKSNQSNIPLKTKAMDLKKPKQYNTILDNSYIRGNDNTKVLSYDPTAPTGPSDPLEPLVHPDVYKILSYWFSLPNTVQHKQSSKAYNNSIQIIDNLLNGLPIQHTKDGQPYKPLQAFCSKHRIDPKLLSRKWPVNQIKKTLRSIHKHLAGETGNGAKGNIPLDMVFWNSHANNGGWSWFLFKASESSVPEQFQGMAAKLAQAIGQDLPEGKLLSWARDLQLLCNTNPAEEVDKVLDWYMQNYDWPYVKSVVSCKDFCQFYKNIKKSMHSWYNDNKSSANKSSRSKIGTRNMECHDKESTFSTGEKHNQEGEQND